MLFSFRSSDADKLFKQKITQINILNNQLGNSSNTKVSEAVKEIFNIAFGKQKPNGIFQDVYKSANTQKQIQWVSKLQVLFSIFGPKADLMNKLLQMKDLRIPLEKASIPQFLVRNKLLKDRESYEFINYSYQGYTVSLLQYMFMRLAWCISQTQFIEGERSSESLFLNDDFYHYISRNPYILLFYKFTAHFQYHSESYKKIIGAVKLVLFQQALLKYKTNLSGSNISYTYKYKVKLNYFYMIYLMLRKRGDCFNECQLFLRIVLDDFSNILYTQNQSNLRTILRVILFAFNPVSIECKVIDSLQNANKATGWFDLKHYTLEEYSRTIRNLDKKSKSLFLAMKSQIIHVLQTDINYLSKGRVFNYSFLHNLACFFKFQQTVAGKQNSMYESSEKNKQKSMSQTLKNVLQSFYYGVDIINKQSQSKQRISYKIVQQMKQILNYMNEHLKTHYSSKGIDFDKIESQRYRNSFKNQLNCLSPAYSEFKSSLKSFQNVKQRNCWQAPRKQSQLYVLHVLFYSIAAGADKIIPGHKERKYPAINLRYFCNPFVFLILVIVIGLIFKILF